MSIKQKGKGINYKLHKPIIEKAIQERKTVFQLADILGCNYKTAWKYRDKYLNEQGEITDKLVKDMRKKYIATTDKDLDYAETAALSIISNAKNPRDTATGINSLIQTKQEKRKFYESIGVIQTKPTTEVNVNTAIQVNPFEQLAASAIQLASARAKNRGSNGTEGCSAGQTGA